jgi:guanylate kinase
MLILVVGPSGAGKDTVLNGAKRALAGDPGVRFVRRVITRAADPDGEDHEAVSDADFDRRDLALRWQAHGLRYGIPADVADDLARGATVIANVSRGVIAEAAGRFPVRVVEVTAPAAVLARRLAERGREGAADVAARLARAVALPGGVEVVTVVNDGAVEDAVRRFLAAIGADEDLATGGGPGGDAA